MDPLRLLIELSDVAYTRPPHLVRLSEKVQQAIDTPGSRLIVNMPPGHGKTTVAHVAALLYFVLRYPDKVALSFSRNPVLLSAVSLQLDALVPSSYKHPASWSRRTKTTIKGGGIVFASTFGVVEGVRADLLIADDPHGGTDWLRPRLLEDLWNWFLNSAITRLEPGGSLIVPHTRWALLDLTGRILSAGWDVEHELQVVSPDKPLWLERYDSKALAEIKSDIGASIFRAMYEQDPVALTGDPLFDLAWLSDDKLDVGRKVVTVDVAFLAGATNDYTCIAEWRAGEKLSLHDIHYGRFTHQVIRDRLLRLARDHVVVLPPDPPERWVATMLRDAGIQPVVLKKVDYVPSKVGRALRAADWMKEGRLLLPRALVETNPLLIAELSRFPHSSHDDFVDAVSLAVAYESNRLR